VYNASGGKGDRGAMPRPGGEKEREHTSEKKEKREGREGALSQQQFISGGKAAKTE